MPNSDDTGSGPIDGQEIRFDVVPHHQKHSHDGNSLAKIALTGAAIAGGIVGIYFLWKHFFGKKDEKAAEGHVEGEGSGKLRKRDWKVTDVEDEIAKIYTEALEDPEFVKFLEEIKGSGLLEGLDNLY
jgi:hypothetical protein